jgi:hypothetical protein
MGWRRGQAYSQDLRDRVLAAEGSAPVVAARFGVSASYVQRARARRAHKGEVSAGAQRNHVPLRLQGLEQVLKDEVAAHPQLAGRRQRRCLPEHLKGIVGYRSPAAAEPAKAVASAPAAAPAELLRPLAEYDAVVGGGW